MKALDGEKRGGSGQLGRAADSPSVDRVITVLIQETEQENRTLLIRGLLSSRTHHYRHRPPKPSFQAMMEKEGKGRSERFAISSGERLTTSCGAA